MKSLLSAIKLIFGVWQAVMEGYQPTLRIFFSVSQLGGALGQPFPNFSTLVHLRKDGSLFHIAVILDGLGILRKEIIISQNYTLIPLNTSFISESEKIALSR